MAATGRPDDRLHKGTGHDLLCDHEGSSRAELRSTIADDDAYFGELRDRYSRGILDLFERLPDSDWIATGDAGAYD